MGAQSRLLPPSIPFGFFFAALIFHLLFWVGLFFSAEDMLVFAGGTGPALATIHLLTLGVFVMTAMGASFQLLPVATGAGARALWIHRIILFFYVPGVSILVWGFASHMHHAMALGAALTIAALFLYAGVLFDLLRRAEHLKKALAHTWVAWASLILFCLAGFSLIADQEHGFLPDHNAMAVAHMVLAAFGFMGLFAAGFSYILVPMFALSPTPPAILSTLSWWMLVLALGIAVPSILFDFAEFTVIAMVLAILGVGLHLRAMFWSLKNGMRKNLGLSFLMIKGGWGALPWAILTGGLLAAGFLPDQGVRLFGLLVLAGWLLTFLLGVLQRIIPFLASMNMTVPGYKTPTLSALGNEKLLTGHAVCHASACALLAIAFLFDLAPVLQAGALTGFLGACLFFIYALMVLMSYLTYHRQARAGDDTAA